MGREGGILTVFIGNYCSGNDCIIIMGREGGILTVLLSWVGRGEY